MGVCRKKGFYTEGSFFLSKNEAILKHQSKNFEKDLKNHSQLRSFEFKKNQKYEATHHIPLAHAVVFAVDFCPK
jgi:hypothetical protein